MKIRVRLSLLFVLCSTASLLVCGFLLLRASAKGMIRSAQDNAVSELGMLNSRLKDFFDIWLLSEEFDFDYHLLEQAISKTFRRRESILPTKLPIGLSEEFSNDPIKQSQWKAFLRHISAQRKPDSLQDAIDRIRAFLQPFISAKETKRTKWAAGKGWQ